MTTVSLENAATIWNCRAALSGRMKSFLNQTQLPTPFLAVDIFTVTLKYHELQDVLPEALIYYAVKANPMPTVIRRLADIGSRFDVASAEELQQCLALGIPPDRISFGSTIKKASAIAY